MYAFLALNCALAGAGVQAAGSCRRAAYAGEEQKLLAIALIPAVVSPAAMPPAIEERCKAEIVRLHDAFVAWFTGSCDSSGDTYERTIGSVLSPSFSMVTPSGSVIPANLLHERLQAAYGSHSEHGMAIEIKNVEVVSSSGSGNLLRYEEWQRSGSPEVVETARQSTAFFQESGPTKLIIWVHVHETWMPGMGPP